MYGSSNTTVQAPQESAGERAFKEQQAADLAYARNKQIAADKAEEERKSRLRATGLKDAGTYANIFKKQLQTGALTPERAKEAVKKFQETYGLEAGDVSNYLIDIENYELQQLPTQRTTLTQRLFKDLLGREASDQELKQRLGEIEKSGGKLDLDAIGTSIKASDEYKERVGGNYYENYLRTYLGPSEKELVKGKDGAPDWYKSTGKYTVSTIGQFSPTLDADLEKTVGLKFGDLAESFTGSPEEIEAMRQKMRQRDEFAYNSGLTKLQGQIDSDIQKIKNKGTKEVAEISSKSNVYSSLVSGFWS